ncbi:MAG: hypothetical protein B6D55_04370 [Candidatus Omnitrophica bacterium 4484_70.2]|nr:MAG: hypothetical protein B6D55_04370 [Candidatus Omnitrophica bacterium 4484_70.2]
MEQWWQDGLQGCLRVISNVEIIKRILCSLILASLIGLEREKKRQAAGLRTHVLVSVGSSLIMLISLYIFELYKNIATLDPARIAAGVITGIGFLGAGAIIRAGNSVRGLTTAATIWVASGIGLACGCGFFYAAMFVTLVSLIVLLFLRKLEEYLGK